MEDNTKNTELGEQQANNSKTYTEEEVEQIRKDMQSNSEKWVQKVIWEKKVAEQALKEVQNIADDNEHLVKLYDTNPDVAKHILQNVYNWIDIEEYKENIWYKDDTTSPEYLEKIADKKVEKKLTEIKLNDAIDSFIKENKLEWEVLEKFQKELEDRKTMKSFSLQTIDKHLDKALKDSIEESNISDTEYTKKVAETMSTGWWKSGSWSSNWEMQVNSDVTDFVKKFIT